jgi:uncharacterized membrane protein YoaK (UPF0700 family)
MLPALLSGIAGSTDTIGFLALSGLFTAHITGNFVVLATCLVNHRDAPLAANLSVPVFVAALFLARWLAARLDTHGIGSLQPLLVVEFVLLAGFLAIRVLIGAPINIRALAAIFAGMLGVAAMAVQNATAQLSLGALSTTAMTANVVRFALGLAEIFVARNHNDHERWRGLTLHAGPLAGFVLGCVLGAACDVEFGRWSLGLPAALAAFGAAISFAPPP